MAIRVDDIVVTEKNVLLLSGGHQYIADIEKNTDALDSSNYTRDRNPWNFYSSDGHIYHNLFDTDAFDIRSQVLTGSTRHSPNNSRSHESIFMPHDSGYVGNCQFYGNAYTISDFTTSTVSSLVASGDGDAMFGCDHGFIRYEHLSTYDNPTEYFISPSVLFNPTKGVQYLTEYPLNGYYMDFGDNETDGKPTVFGDSVLTKYYLDYDYSVSSYDINDKTTRFRQLRTYYDIGSTGNSIYMVFRNNLYGVSEMQPFKADKSVPPRRNLTYYLMSDGDYVEGGTSLTWADGVDNVYVLGGEGYVEVDDFSQPPQRGKEYYSLVDGDYVVSTETVTILEWDTEDDVYTYELPEGEDGTYYTGYFPASSIAYMSNMVTLLDTAPVHPTSGFYYSSGPYSDMFEYVQMQSLSSGLVGIRQPRDMSFILYVQNGEQDGCDVTRFTYIPKIGLERSAYEHVIFAKSDDIDIAELPHCVVIGTPHNGILTVWSRDYLYNGGDTLVDFNPFQYACSGIPSSESLTSTIDGNVYRNISLYYNGKDMLAAKATVSNELSGYGARVAFFSTNYEDAEREYEMGQFFMPAGNPSYEIEVITSEEYEMTKTLSSVPVSTMTENGNVTWSFEMREVDVVTGVTSVTSDPFQVSANYIYDSDILFDYSSTVVENELEIGSYAFVQFEKYGLGKCYTNDIYSEPKMVKFTPTGPSNFFDSRVRTWNRVADATIGYDAVSSGAYGSELTHIRGKSNNFKDLSAIPSDTLSVDDIYSLVEGHSEDGWSSGDYAYFSYVVEGNTSSWNQTSVDYIEGHVDDFEELCDIAEPSGGDTYLMKQSHVHTALNMLYAIDSETDEYVQVGDSYPPSGIDPDPLSGYYLPHGNGTFTANTVNSLVIRNRWKEDRPQTPIYTIKSGEVIISEEEPPLRRTKYYLNIDDGDRYNLSGDVVKYAWKGTISSTVYALTAEVVDKTNDPETSEEYYRRYVSGYLLSTNDVTRLIWNRDDYEGGYLPDVFTLESTPHETVSGSPPPEGDVSYYSLSEDGDYANCTEDAVEYVEEEGVYQWKQDAPSPVYTLSVTSVNTELSPSRDTIYYTHSTGTSSDVYEYDEMLTKLVWFTPQGENVYEIKDVVVVSTGTGSPPPEMYRDYYFLTQGGGYTLATEEVTDCEWNTEIVEYGDLLYTVDATYIDVEQHTEPDSDTSYYIMDDDDYVKSNNLLVDIGWNEKAFDYSFYSYDVRGNLSAWDYNGDAGQITARRYAIDRFPGYDGTRPAIGDVCLLTESDSVNGFSTPNYSFYIYDIEGLRGESYIKKWTPIDVTPIIFNGAGTDSTFIGSMNASQMITSETIRKIGLFGVLVDDGSYGEIPFSKGDFYYFAGTGEPDSINGWKFCTDKVGFTNTALSAGYNFTDSTYIGYFQTYSQMTHISPPRYGSICLVLDNYSEDSVDYPPYTYFKYGYEDNQLGWWKFNPSTTYRIVDDYEGLYDLANVDEDEICIVKNPYGRESHVNAADSFMTFGTTGNVSDWRDSSECGNVVGVVTNVGNLDLLDSPDDGDIYVVRNSEDEDGYDRPPQSFYRYVRNYYEGENGEPGRYGNTAQWLPCELSASPYLIPVSGYAETFMEIDNLSGDEGSYYFTESLTSELVFYRLEENVNRKYCTDATFSVLSYGDESKKPILDAIDYIASDYSMYYVTGKPALKSTFRSADGTRYTNSFSAFPFDDRTMSIKEPIFSTVKSKKIEIAPVDEFKFALEKPVENSMGVTVSTFKGDGVNHDAAISLVRWNESDGIYDTSTQETDVGGLYLQYNGICTDVYMNGTVLSSTDRYSGNVHNRYSSTIYEYPHPCYGELRTAGTGLPIFEGPLSGDMRMDDMFFVNGYFVVKNYSVSSVEGRPDKDFPQDVLESGKHHTYDTGRYPRGGYVVTNFFADTGDGSGIPFLYGSKLVESSKEKPKTSADSERFYDYNFLWHIYPTKPIEFYPESVPGKTWTPYYTSKYVDFIRYHNGYYYISLRSKREHDSDTVGYDIIETDTLFAERKTTPLPDNLMVSDVRFFDSHVAVEYEKLNGERFIKWFECGKSHYKVLPVMYSEDVSEDDAPLRKSVLTSKDDVSSDVLASYDNVEVLNSLNRFTPVVNHKSNLFSIRIEDLGFEDSEYLTDYQKKVLRTYFRNSITELVNAVKPAHTQLFDVYL